MRKLLLLSALICLTISSFAQIEIDQSYTIEEYVNDILLGSGISASNISFTGSETQIGFLTGGEGTIFPMDAGLVLSSEHAINLQQAGADGLPADDVIPAGEEVSGEPDLLTIANSVPPLIGESFSVGSVNDVAILEFDKFQPVDSFPPGLFDVPPYCANATAPALGRQWPPRPHY